jgi:hypothetical protein
VIVVVGICGAAATSLSAPAMVKTKTAKRKVKADMVSIEKGFVNLGLSDTEIE